MFTKEVYDRFWTKVDRSGDCWLWTDAVSPAGYGVFNPFKYKTVRAHRVSYEFYFGEIQRGKIICHRCDNPPCVRPEHLFSGTRQDNNADCVQKGRHAEGEKGGGAKLTTASVLAIRTAYAAKEADQYQLAKRFNVSRSAIQQIVERRNWKHI